MTDKVLRLYNTLTRSKEDFAPIDPNNVRMYVCGPTVYDFAHIGNARPVIVFDVLFRLLRHLYGEDHVTYVRNITDVDDKINDRALRDFGADIASGKLSLNEAIRRVTEKTANQFHDDVKAVGCLPPTHEPRATEFVEPRPDGKTDMIGLIQNLIARGHAYEANGEVLFDTRSMPDYGQLSKRPLDQQQAGARIAVDAHKKSPGDFVLWKLSSPEEPGWNSPWGRGRPGWHIECSAMSAAYLGEVFDIHGGGLDLIFPHHENEIAQSRCAHGTDVMANYWLHNGFLQVEGRKMSKSEGNFVTIYELLHTEKFGGRKWPGEVLRLAMLMTHYREPIDFSVRRLEEAENILMRWSNLVDCFYDYIPDNADDGIVEYYKNKELGFEDENGIYRDYDQYMGEISDDLNFSKVVSRIQSDIASINRRFPGISVDEVKYLKLSHDTRRCVAKVLDALGFNLKRNRELSKEQAASIDRRLALIAAKNWAEADRIRDELLAQGIQLKDGKDPTTGERITTWEVKR